MNGTVLGTPNYSKLDNQVIFTVPDGGTNSIAIIDMQDNKLVPSSENAFSLITDAKWGIWFSQGSRPLLQVDEINSGMNFSLYPNPADDYVNLVFNGEPVKNVSVKVFDVRGICVVQLEKIPGENFLLDISNLPEGLYLVNLASGKNQIYKKLMIR
jgi:hypothetical protein